MKMADKHGLNYDVRELKLGSSFTNNKTSQYHTIKYDFKPASVDVNKMATVDVGTNNQVTVTVPHLDGAGVPHTVFKGSQRPYAKECVLIIDRVTGEITLEKLSSNIQVKKTRQESSSKPRPLTPVTQDLTNTTQRSTSRTRVATNRRGASHQTQSVPVPGQSQSQAQSAAAGGSHARYGSQKTPPTMVRSPPRFKTSPPQAPWSAGGNSTLASLPMIGFDEAPSAPPAAPPVAPPAAPPHAPPAHNGYRHQPEHYRHAPPERAIPERIQPAPERIQPAPERQAPSLPTATGMAATQRAEASSSSSSSDSDSGSGSDSDSDDNEPSRPAPPAPVNGGAPLPSDVLNDDLCLSESGSDSD